MLGKKRPALLPPMGEEKEAHEALRTFQSMPVSLMNSLRISERDPFSRLRAFLAQKVIQERRFFQPGSYMKKKGETGDGKFIGNVFSRITQRRGSEPYLFTQMGPSGSENIHPDIFSEAHFQHSFFNRHPEYRNQEVDGGTAREIELNPYVELNSILPALIHNRKIINSIANRESRPYRSAFYSELEPCDSKNGQGCRENISHFLTEDDKGWHGIDYNKQEWPKVGEKGQNKMEREYKEIFFNRPPDYPFAPDAPIPSIIDIFPEASTTYTHKKPRTAAEIAQNRAIAMAKKARRESGAVVDPIPPMPPVPPMHFPPEPVAPEPPPEPLSEAEADDFYASKRRIPSNPAERTPEQQAELEARKARARGKENKRGGHIKRKINYRI